MADLNSNNRLLTTRYHQLHVMCIPDIDIGSCTKTLDLRPTPSLVMGKAVKLYILVHTLYVPISTDTGPTVGLASIVKSAMVVLGSVVVLIKYSVMHSAAYVGGVI